MAKPDHPDVCIVGGGIVGLSSAYFLAQNGLSVTILERDSVGSHASGFAYGSLSPLGEAGLVEDILPELTLAREAMSIHTEWAKSLPPRRSKQYHHSRGYTRYALAALWKVPALDI
ncbi:MAG: FAD-dependent oxidoreductase, partial [Chloroflexota bacterium]|nr:FAD-dependent oxidoreductase [Chloroflexota bacterium]